jgi:pentatricopeptide repeat protein
VLTHNVYDLALVLTHNVNDLALVLTHNVYDLALVQTAGLYRDVMLCNAMMAALVRADRVMHGERILATMKQTPAQMGRPNVVSYTILIHGYSRHNNAERAVQLLEEAEAAGLQPDARMMATVITVCGGAGDVTGARRYLDRLLAPPMARCVTLAALCPDAAPRDGREEVPRPMARCVTLAALCPAAGLVCSGKYEGAQLIFKCPRVIVAPRASRGATAAATDALTARRHKALTHNLSQHDGGGDEEGGVPRGAARIRGSRTPHRDPAGHVCLV